MTMMRSCRQIAAEHFGWVTAIALSVTLALALPVPTSAQQAPRLQGQVTDLTRNQVLAGGRTQIDTALNELLQSQNVQLFVLFVDSAGGRSATGYADEVARQNSLGGNDALLVVAVDDRIDAFWRGSASLERLTDRELEEVLTRRVEPLLAQGDFTGAVIASTEGIAQIAGEGASSSSGANGGGLNVAPILGLLVVGGGGFVAWKVISRRRGQQQREQQERVETERLANEANALLIAADETLRDAREEADFAEAQFGTAEVTSYRQAIVQASDELMAAFTERQRLDDAEPEDPAMRRRIVEDVIDRARRVQSLLDEQAERLDQLRDLERTAPEVLAALPGQIDTLAARVPAAEQTLASLARYAESSRASVIGNIDAVREMVTAARAATADGQQSLGSDEPGATVRAVRTAQQAVQEAGRLLDAIDSLATSLRQAEAAAGTRFAAAAADVQGARTALTGSDRADLNGRLAEAEATLQQAQQAMTAERPDYLAATRLIAQADSAADQILADLKEEAERRDRERRLLDTQLQTAAAEYDRTADFISARRRLIGSVARTRLAEAARHLERARTIAVDDPTTALAEARRAESLAEDAYRRAMEDVQASEPYGGGFGGRMGGVIMPIPFPMGRGGFGGGVGGGFGGGFGRGRSGGGGVRSGGGGRSVGGRW